MNSTEPSLKPLLNLEANVAAEIIGIGTAVPPYSASQNEILDFVTNNFTIKESTKILYKRTFSNRSIEKRHFYLKNLDQILDRNHDSIHHRFTNGAIELSTRSLKNGLEASGVAALNLDFLVTTTCTGYLCPGLSSYLVESCHLRKNIRTVDLVGMGCGAALPGLEQAFHFVRSRPGSIAAVVCTEICSAAFFSNDEPDIVISNTLFSDGSACVVLKSSPANNDGNNLSKHPQLIGFSSLTTPEWRETLRFKYSGGFLKNVLGETVPEQSADALEKITTNLFMENNLTRDFIRHWILHSGGEKVLSTIESKLKLERNNLSSSRVVLRNFGNMSSPSVLFVLEEEMKNKSPQKGAWGILASFGAGFTAHAALVRF
jgi:alkylresorcinol/alkylpyrone synthase